jgi:ferritin-like metal-binding protein YciE
MPPETLDEQLTKYLTDAHSIEAQALIQMKTAPKIAGEERFAEIFRRHETETEEHERLVTERLEARDATPSKLKDLAGKVTGAGFGLFAMAQPDTPGKLAAHAYSYEHMEEAAWDMIARIAARVGDSETETVARRIEAQEREMGERVAGFFDAVVEASLRDVPREDIDKQLDKYLADAHAIEGQSLQLLDKGADIAGADALAALYEEHRLQTLEHQRLLDARLEQRGASPSTLKDAALQIGALNWGGFFAAQPDTPAKLAAFAYAVEHLEAAAYELLRRVAERAGDSETVQVAERILTQEREAGARIHDHFDEALDATLSERSLSS